MRSHVRSIRAPAALLLAGLLALAPVASAVYVVTPLQLHASDLHVEVASEVRFEVEPQNASEAAAWAGRSIAVLLRWDANERAADEGPDAPVDDGGMQERTLVSALPLDEGARASFAWTVPAEVDGHNVDVVLVDGEGEPLGFAHLAVGDAPPQMRVLAGSGPAQAEPDVEGSPEPAAPAVESPPGGADVPALGAGVLLALLGAGALARRR